MTSGIGKSQTVGTPQFAEESRAFLQKRLSMLVGVLSMLFWLMSLAFVVTMLAGGERSVGQVLREFTLEFPNAVLFLLATVTGVVYLVLRGRALSARSLALLDAVWFLSLTGVCLVLYAVAHTYSFSGFAFVATFLVLFILSRAILIPSTALRTFFLSLPSALGVLIVQLWHGASYAFPGQPYRPAHFLDVLIQNQICLLGAVAVAVVASRVNLSLRRRHFDAQRVGQYQLVEPIGAGAMGEVHLATHSLLKRKTAIKFLRPEITGEETLARFEQEVRLASGLTHPNNISIYDYGYTAEGVFYYAMELLDGATLQQILDQTGPMPPARVVHVLAQACGALREAHEKGILHRDIKSANIMLCEQGGEPDRVKVLDFGLAKRLDRSGLVRADGTLAGSPETLSPEAIRGQDVGPAADIYALAVVGYQLLSGRHPFEASSGEGMMRQHLTSDPAPPRSPSGSPPEDLSALLLQGLDKDPGERPESAASFRRRLLECEGVGGWSEEEAARWWSRYQDRLRSAPMTPSSLSDSSVETRTF